ncbi:START domain-containing protein [Colwellia sp. C1TZA3]|uniref:START domain-containing protein n=1 Tax=Colwellia sp. C1TZA3 TaxID=2508879 RepID=UPI00174A3438|nr:START domain-containing protein [Colwellia sp. C1TZA3]
MHQVSNPTRISLLVTHLTSLNYPLLISLLLLSHNVQANALSSWKVWQQNSDLSVLYRASQYNDVIEIKAQAKVNSSLAGFIYFIEDFKLAPHWLDNVESAKCISQISSEENVFITRFKGLWPISAREIVAHSRYWQNEDLSVEIAVKDAGDTIEKNQNVIRMKVLSAHWTIVPLDNKRIAITYQFMVDPKGNVPLWLTKPITLNGIWTTLHNIQRQLPKSKWQQQVKSNIQEIQSQ